MSAVKGGIYQRGEFWLDYVRGAGGKPASDRLYIWWTCNGFVPVT